MSENSPDSGRMSQAVTDTLGALRLGPEHVAIATLARELARLLDAGDATTYARLAPKLAGVLRELGATPAPGGRPVRPAAPGGDHQDDERDDDGESELAELIDLDASRADRAARLD